MRGILVFFYQLFSFAKISYQRPVSPPLTSLFGLGRYIDATRAKNMGGLSQKMLMFTV